LPSPAARFATGKPRPPSAASSSANTNTPPGSQPWHPPAAPRRPPAEPQQTAGAADPLRSPSIGHHDTPDGRAARLASYEARKLNNPPNSLDDRPGSASSSNRRDAVAGHPAEPGSELRFSPVDQGIGDQDAEQSLRRQAELGRLLSAAAGYRVVTKRWHPRRLARPRPL
jgi:hypothetical protein